jgi:hypothetical protein
MTALLRWDSVLNLTLLNINSEGVIPAPYQVRGKLQQESSQERTGFPRIPWSGLIDKYGAGLIKSGMTTLEGFF